MPPFLHNRVALARDTDVVPDRLSDAWFPSCSSRSTINYSNVARDAQVPRQTVVQWYEVLRDTLIAFELPA